VSRRAASLTLTITLLIVFGLLFLTQTTHTTPKLGLDLQGGFSVVLDAPEGTPPDVLEQAVSIMRRRIEALGNVQEPEIAILGDRSVEVQLPGVTDRERALAAVGTTGQLEFRPVLEISPIPDLSPVFTATTTTTTTTVPDTTTTTAGGTTTTTGRGTTRAR
jgi:preprotein translocase subunit SecD